jgi:hypothetical protein
VRRIARHFYVRRKQVDWGNRAYAIITYNFSSL